MALDDDAYSRALFMAGMGMMGQPNLMAALSRGGMFGAQSYDNALEQKRKAQDDALMQQMRQLQAAQLGTSLQREQQRLAILGGQGPGAPQAPSQPSTPSVVLGSDLASNPLYKPAQPSATAPAAGNPTTIAQKLLAAGFVKDAEEYAKANGVILGDDRYGKIEPKDYTPDSLRKFQGSGNRADLVPRDEIVADNLGGQLSYRTKYSTNPLGKADKTMTLAEQDAKSRGWATFGLDKAKFDRGEFSTSVPLPSGNTGAGFVTPAGGFTQAAGTGEKNDQPAAIRTALATNDVLLDKLDRATQAVQSYPEAFGAKNYLGDAVRQRTNPQGVDARALVADIGSQVLHDRSGASVTISEAPRLQPFVPAATDNDQTILKKLSLMRIETSKMRDELAGGRSISQVSAPKDLTGGGKTPSIAEIQAEMLRRGKRGS